MSKDIFNGSSVTAEAAPRKIYMLVTRAGDVGNGQPRIRMGSNDILCFEFSGLAGQPAPVDFPFGHLPTGLLRKEWDAEREKSPGLPPFDEVKAGDWIKVMYSYDPSPENKGAFSYWIKSIEHAPSHAHDNVVAFPLGRCMPPSP